MSTTVNVAVTGMTCAHCASSVSKEIRGIDGVTDVEVNVGTGRVVVHADRDLDAAAIDAAVQEAGYSVAG
jgi:copper chaperone CopZ